MTVWNSTRCTISPIKLLTYQPLFRSHIVATNPLPSRHLRRLGAGLHIPSVRDDISKQMVSVSGWGSAWWKFIGRSIIERSNSPTVHKVYDKAASRPPTFCVHLVYPESLWQWPVGIPICKLPVIYSMKD